jgi:hypothetical protein
MIDETTQRIFRKLSWYFENKIPIHVNSIFGFRNGMILDLSEKKMTVVIKDMKGCCTPLLLEDIYEDSISEYRPPNENKI